GSGRAPVFEIFFRAELDGESCLAHLEILELAGDGVGEKFRGFFAGCGEFFSELAEFLLCAFQLPTDLCEALSRLIERIRLGLEFRESREHLLDCASVFTPQIHEERETLLDMKELFRIDIDGRKVAIELQARFFDLGERALKSFLRGGAL